MRTLSREFVRTESGCLRCSVSGNTRCRAWIRRAQSKKGECFEEEVMPIKRLISPTQMLHCVYVCFRVLVHALSSGILHWARGALSWAASLLVEIHLVLRNTFLICPRLLLGESRCVEAGRMRLIVIWDSHCYQRVPLLLQYSMSRSPCADEHSAFLCHTFTDLSYL